MSFGWRGYRVLLWVLLYLIWLGCRKRVKVEATPLER
jgi:hypothetical protein